MAWIGVSPKVIAINQPTSSTCWLSCLQMLFVWKGRDPNDVRRILDADPNFMDDYWILHGVAPYNGIQIAQSLGLGAAGNGSVDADVMANALLTHGPYWVAGEWIKGSPHVIVLTGVNLQTNKVKVMNPWNNFDGSESEMWLDDFNNRGPVWSSTFGSMLYWPPESN